jgi:hypothetical protein
MALPLKCSCKLLGSYQASRLSICYCIFISRSGLGLYGPRNMSTRIMPKEDNYRTRYTSLDQRRSCRRAHCLLYMLTYVLLKVSPFWLRFPFVSLSGIEESCRGIGQTDYCILTCNIRTFASQPMAFSHSIFFIFLGPLCYLTSAKA